MKSSRRQLFADFKRDFADLCRDWQGVEKPGDAIGGGLAFRFQTTFGELRASIHAPIESLGDYKNASRFQFCMGSVYLRFEDYTGPYPAPFDGNFSRYCHKWNIHFSGEPKPSSDAALNELVRRLSLVIPQTKLTP